MPLCPIKWRPLKVFAKLHKSLLLIANTVKGAVSGMRQFLATESFWKIMKDTFHFILTNWICYWQVKFCSYYAFSLNQMSDIRQVSKYWPLKDGFRSISQKFYRVGGWTKDIQTFSRHFFWERPSKYWIVEFTGIFVWFLLSWSSRYSMEWSSNFDAP